MFPVLQSFSPVPCSIQHKHLATGYFNYEDVMKTFLEMINFIRLNGMIHRQFRNVFEELELGKELIGVSSYSIVKLFLPNNVLIRFAVQLKLIIFHKEKTKSYLQQENAEWMKEFIFFTDNHLQILNF